MSLETTNSTSQSAPVTPAPRPALRGGHQAIVVVERRMARSGDQKTTETPPGWQWVLGNAKISDLYERILTEANLTWSCLVVPEEQKPTFASLTASVPGQCLVSFDGQLKIKPELLPKAPQEDESLYLVLNGHTLAICDLDGAIAVHRQNRCDVTLIDFHRQRESSYEEKLRMGKDGSVQRVDRTYGNGQERASLSDGDRDWPAVMIFSSAAIQQILDVPLPSRLSMWPTMMLRAGLRMRGSTISGRCFSLHDREHLYQLNEMLLRLRPQWVSQAGNLVDQGQRIWVGRNVRISSSAQLIGPVAIGDDVEIGSDAVVVGPTTIGRGSKVGSGVVLKRCVVLPNTSLAAATRDSGAISHAIVLGADKPSIHAITAGPPDRVFQALPVDRQIKLETVLEAGAMPAFNGIGFRAFCFSKRLVDILGSVAMLAVTLPFYPLIAIAIKINSPGSVFYAHVRQGRGGTNFRCWKFRTMVPNADEIKRKLMIRNEVDGPQFKMKDDPRIFLVGRILRKLNMDEWPQFFNVLIGQMSLVGPRPSPEKENQMCPAWREARLSVRPGITGLWQVCRRRDRGENDFQEWIYYDVMYVKKQSVWLDVKIMFKTIAVLLGGGQ